MEHTARRPYMLPRPLTCDAANVADGVSMELANEYIDKHEKRFPRYEYLEQLYMGFHDIYKQPEKESWKPDHRLAVNFPRYITETFTGYGYGIPIKVSHPDEKVNKAVQEFGKHNEITDHDAEMVKKCCIYGHAWEYLYQNEDSRTKLSSFNPKEIVVVYDKNVTGKALFGIRYGYYKADNGSIKRHGEILTREQIEPFRDKEKLAAETRDNPYGYIPLVEWRLNDERLGLYEPVAGLIEEYNHTISEKGNDVDAFADAYLAVLGAELGDDQIYHIRDDRLINIFGTDNAKDIVVDFLSKPTADGTQENLLDRLENLIYQTSMVANISDETFGNATSGAALAYKLQAMSNLALTFDRKIDKSLHKRYKIFCSLGTNVPDPNAWEDIEITMTRNLPKNLKEEAEVARSLEGVISKETQLKVLSIVDDPQTEIKRLEEENAYDQPILGRTGTGE